MQADHREQSPPRRCNGDANIARSVADKQCGKQRRAGDARQRCNAFHSCTKLQLLSGLYSVMPWTMLAVSGPRSF